MQVPGIAVQNGSDITVDVLVTFNGTTTGYTDKTFTISGTGYIL